MGSISFLSRWVVYACIAAVATACPGMKVAMAEARIKVPAIFRVSNAVPAPLHGVSDLKFSEMFKLPVGPYGLEPTERASSLDGKRVRLVGYMVKQESPASGEFFLSPLPVTMGDEDESAADDLPAVAVLVHLPATATWPVPYLPGLIQIQGVLSIGAREEGDGRVSSVRLLLDPAVTQALQKMHRSTAKHSSKKTSP